MTADWKARVDTRNQLLAAAASELLCTDSAGYLLSDEAASHVADLLLWVAGRTTQSLVTAAVSLAECLVIDDSERMTTAVEHDAADAAFHGGTS